MLSGHAGASGFFVVASLSEVVHVTCAFQQGVVDVQWINVPDQFILEPFPSLEENSTAVMSFSVDENKHGQRYTCRGRMEGSKQQFVYKHYTIIARGTV